MSNLNRPTMSVVKLSNWIIFLKPVLICLLTSLFAWTSPVNAEGSFDLIGDRESQISYGGYRPYLEFADHDLAGIKQKNNVKVFVKAGEQVHVGSSVPHSANGNADIVYYWPGTNPPLVNGEPVAAQEKIEDDKIYYYNSFDVDASTCGLIDTLTKEKIGPLPGFGGYTPCSFIAQETGIYEIEFRAPLLKSEKWPKRDKPDKVKPVLVTEPFPIDDQQKQAVAAWDVTVFQTPDDFATIQLGRAYATFFPFDTGTPGGNGGKRNPPTPILYSQVYFLNESGYLYHVKLNGIDPFQFLFFTNSKGFQDDAGNSLYTSVEFSQLEKQQAFLHDPSKPDTETNTTHKIFFNVPSSDLPLDSDVPVPGGGTTWLSSTPPALPQIENFRFIGEEGSESQTGTKPLTGSFYFDTNTGGDYIITIDNNSNGVFGDENDRKLKGTATVGKNTISWNGVDGDGQEVPAQSLIYDAALTLVVGAMHFPFLDPENNPNGLIVSRVNCEQLPCIIEDNTVFYDNSGLNLKEKKGKKNQGAPSPISATSGVDSSNGAQKFTREFGESRGIDTWTSLATKPLILTGGLELKQADISVSKTHDTSIKLVPGGPITYTITVHNAGPSHVEGIQVQDNLPATITDPFWTCEVTESAPEPTIQNRCAANNVEGPLNTTVDLQNGATATFLVEATISASVAEGATIDNSVTVTRPPDVTNPAGEQLDVKTETATHSVTLAPPTNDPPVAQDKETTTTNDTPVQIPALSAQDSDGTVASYKIFQLPSKSKGLLYLGNPATGGTLITEGQSLTPAQISTLYFQPDPSFKGEVQFNYQASDNQGAASNTAIVTIKVTVPPNLPPVADPKTAPEMPNDLTMRLPALSGSDEDGKIVSFTVTTLPPAAQGILYLGDPSAGGQRVALGQKLILNEGSALFFKPKPNTTGEVTFNYLTTDDRGADSTPAPVTIPVKEANQPPTAINKEIPAIFNNITVALPALSAVDPDGSIESYRITTLPATTEGMVYLGDPAQGAAPLFIGKTLTPEEAKLLYFKPNSNFTGEAHITYTATDNDDAVSNTATVKIPILAPPNEPPVANNDSATTDPNTPITLPILSNDNDPDGDLDRQSVIITIPPSSGTVTVNSDGTVTYLPKSGFTSGNDIFTYQVCDTRTPPLCDTAIVTITVPTQLPPIADNKEAPSTLNNTTVQLPKLSARDLDGTVTKYTIATLPLPTQGVLYFGNPAQGGRLVTVGEELSLDQVGELFFQPDGDFIGYASFTYTATDNLDAVSNPALVTIPVEAPVNNRPLANDDFTSTDPNKPVTIAVLTNDSDSEGELDSSSVRIISPPPNGTVTVNADGSVVYTPNPGFTTGFDVFSYEVCDLGTPPQCDTALVTVRVPISVNQPPLAHDKQTSPTPNNITITVPTLSAVDNDGTVVSFTITTLPPINQGILYLGKPDENGVSIEAGQILTLEQISQLYFQPNSHFVGYASFTYAATDDQGLASNRALVTMPFVAAAVNKPPIANDDTASTNPDTPVTIAILQNDSDPEGSLDPSDITILNPPPNGQVVINPDGTVTYTPNPGFTTGIDTFTYEVCDSGEPTQCDTAQVSVTVPIPVDPPPTALNRTAGSTTNDQVVSLPALLATDNGTVVSYTIATLPPPNQGVLYLGNPNSGGTPITSGQILTPGQEGQLFFQPNPDFIGNASFTYSATDNVGGVSNIALVTVPVTAPANLKPDARDDVDTTEPDTPVTIDILTNDQDPEDNLDPSSVLITKQPTHGTIRVNADATVTYTPNPGIGNVIDTLTYKVCDSAKPPLCDSAKVTITIPGLTNNPPIAHDDSRVTDPETPVKINILDNDSDPDGALDPKSVTIITQAPNGQVIVNPDGSVTYTPNPGFTTGIDVFVYQVCDTGTPSQCAQATVSVTVPIPANLPPVADNKTAAETANDASVQLPALSATDGDGSIASYTIDTLPPVNQGVLYLGDPLAGGIPVTAGQVLAPNQISQLFFQPNPRFVGDASFSYTATDNLDAVSSPALVTIPVIPGEQPVDLSVSIRGEGQVNSEPLGIECNSDIDPCTHTYDFGTGVNLMPIAEPGWEFEGWRGHCDNNDQVEMDGFKQCKAIFIESTTPQHPLTIEKPDGGTVKTQPTGIDCGPAGDDCSEEYASGSYVDLTAEPEPGYGFVEWSGDCHGTSPTITVIMGNELNCKAIFSKDGDEDGVASVIEDGAPNNGDGNNDGIPDSQQNNVVSLLTPEGKYITIEEQSGCTINEIKINQDSLPKDGDYYYPALLDYSLSSCPEADIKIYYHDVADLGDQPHRKYESSQWQDQDNVTQGSELINGKPVAFETFKLQGDTDGQINHTSGIAITPGQIQLSSDNYTIDEFGNVATITVRRTGGCEGNITVNYTTQPQTATPGTDYTPVNGTITWADGDCSDKLITIPIIDEDNPETDETFLLKLSNATGGATITTPESVVTIKDDDPPDPRPDPSNPCEPSSCAGTCCGNSCSSCQGNCSCGTGTCPCQNGCSSCQPINIIMTTTIQVGETETMTVSIASQGDLVIKEMPNKAVASLESLKPLGAGIAQLSLKGLNVGETKMILSDSAAPTRTVTIYITVEGGGVPGPRYIEIDLEVGQHFRMTDVGTYYGKLSIDEIPDPQIALLEDWTGSTGIALFELVGVSPGRTKLILIDQATPPQEIIVDITVGGGTPPSDPCENQAVGIDAQGNPVDSQICFKGKINIDNKLQSNHRRMSAQEAKQIKVLATIQIDPAHVGQAADILTVGIRRTLLTETQYTRDDQTWKIWDGQISSLPVAQYYPQLPETIEVFLYEGDLSGMPGEYYGYVGYRLTDGTLFYNGIEPIHFYIGNSASIDMRGDPQKIPMSTDAYTTSFFETWVHDGNGKTGNNLTFDNEAELTVSTFVEVEPQYVGRPADILMVAVHNIGINQFEYTRNGPKWIGWDSRLESLSAAQHYHQLPAVLEVPIYLGSLAHVPGEFTGYVGYRLPEGLIVFNGFMPIRVIVANSIGLDAQANQFATTTRFISWGHHGGHLGNPFGAFANQSLSLETTIWVDSQHQGQTADIQMIGLCCQWSEQQPLWGQWNEQQVRFQTTIPNVTLPAKLDNLHLYEATLLPGEYTVYIGYRLANGDTVYNGAEPLRLKILAP